MEYVQIINKIWNREINFFDFLEIINKYEAAHHLPEVAVLYLVWIDRNDSPYNAAAYFNLGVLNFSLGNYKKSISCYENVKKLNSGLIEARLNMGLALEKLGEFDAAYAEWKEISQHADVNNEEHKKIIISSFNNLARLQENRKIYDDANFYLNKSLELDPSQTEVLHHLVFVRARQCLWPVYEAPEGVDLQLMKDSTSALAMIALSDDPQKQLDAAKNYALKRAPLEDKLLSQGERYGHEKIRIGYCSSDFSLHPVSMLTVELFELHNREKFEVYGFCWSPNDGSELRARVVNAFDHYIPIGDLDDKTAAEKIRSLEIDVLIDLQGQTAGARMNMLSWRPAPLQITYLGLPATTGMPSIDYVIADKYLIPENFSENYSENIIYMPDIYQVSDRQRMHNVPLTRKEYGLPARGFVFCSFNNNYKYTLEIFTCWMNILKNVPRSVLWLLSDNPIAEKNLKLQAKNQGVDPKRLIFSGRVHPSDYLARYLVADLFLDTFPFNAGTTANDALWMGLPLLTVSGRAFASRMAGALLTAAGIPELITVDVKDYEEKAIHLASNSRELKNIRKKLENVKKTGVLFDTPKFVANFEEKLINLVGNAPEGVPNESVKSMAKKCQENRPQTLVDVVAAAENKILENDLRAASSIYEQYLEKTGNAAAEWMAHFNYAVTLLELDVYDAAKLQFELTLIKKPDWEPAKIGLKNVMLRSSKILEATT